MRKRALSAAVFSALLAIPLFGPGSVLAQPSPAARTAAAPDYKPVDTVRECPNGDALKWVDCTKGTFVLEAAEKISVRVAEDSEVGPADFAVVDPKNPEGENISELEGVDEKWKDLWSNKRKDKSVPVLLQASPAESFHDGKTIKVDVRITVIRLTALDKVVPVEKNTTAVVSAAKNLTVGKPPIWIDKYEKARHGKVSVDEHRQKLTYKPAKNFTGDETILYWVKNRRGETDFGLLFFEVR